MKISQIDLTPLALAFSEPYHWAGRVDYGATVILVEVRTDEGVVGVGESTAGMPAEGTLASLLGIVPLLVGEPAQDIQRLMTKARYLGGFNHTPWAAGLALAGLEIALWDIAGKAAGRPVHELLGGAVRESVDYFGFPQGATPQTVAARARTLAADGYRTIYVKVGRGEELDLRTTAAVRAAIADARLRLDANGAWSVPEAIHMIGKLAVYDPEWIEQPTAPLSVSALRQVKESVDVPIAADQCVFTAEDVYEVCRLRAADAVVLSPHEAGGLLAFRKAAAVAEAAGVPVCLHGQSVSGISDAAQHHAGLSTPNLCEGNQIMHQLLVEDLVLTPDLTPRQARLGRDVASGFATPGLGVTLDRDAVARAAERYRIDPRYHHS